MSYSEKDGVEMSGVETGGSGTEEMIRFWACRVPRCSSLTVTKRDVLDDELGSKETGAGRARRNPACLRERLARGLSSAEEGRLDIRKQTGGILGNNLAPYWDM